MAVKLRLNHAGIRQLATSSAVAGEVNKAATTILRRAGEGFAMKSGNGSKRAHAVVFTDTIRARYHQAREHILERAVGSG